MSISRRFCLTLLCLLFVTLSSRSLPDEPEQVVRTAGITRVGTAEHPNGGMRVHSTLELPQASGDTVTALDSDSGHAWLFTKTPPMNCIKLRLHDGAPPEVVAAVAFDRIVSFPIDVVADFRDEVAYVLVSTGWIHNTIYLEYGLAKIHIPAGDAPASLLSFHQFDRSLGRPVLIMREENTGHLNVAFEPGHLVKLSPGVGNEEPVELSVTKFPLHKSSARLWGGFLHEEAGHIYLYDEHFAMYKLTLGDSYRAPALLVATAPYVPPNEAETGTKAVVFPDQGFAFLTWKNRMVWLSLTPGSQQPAFRHLHLPSAGAGNFFYGENADPLIVATSTKITQYTLTEIGSAPQVAATATVPNGSIRSSFFYHGGYLYASDIDCPATMVQYSTLETAETISLLSSTSLGECFREMGGTMVDPARNLGVMSFRKPSILLSYHPGDATEAPSAITTSPFPSGIRSSSFNLAKDLATDDFYSTSAQSLTKFRLHDDGTVEHIGSVKPIVYGYHQELHEPITDSAGNIFVATLSYNFIKFHRGTDKAAPRFIGAYGSPPTPTPVVTVTPDPPTPTPGAVQTATPTPAIPWQLYLPTESPEKSPVEPVPTPVSIQTEERHPFALPPTPQSSNFDYKQYDRIWGKSIDEQTIYVGSELVAFSPGGAGEPPDRKWVSYVPTDGTKLLLVDDEERSVYARYSYRLTRHRLPTATGPATLLSSTENLNRWDFHDMVADFKSDILLLGATNFGGEIWKFRTGQGDSPPLLAGKLNLGYGYGSFRSFDFSPETGFLYHYASYFPGITKVSISHKSQVRAMRIKLHEEASPFDFISYCHSAAGSIRLGVYRDNGPTMDLVWSSPVVLCPQTESWLKLPVCDGEPDNLILSPGSYWLAWQTDSNAMIASHVPASQKDAWLLWHEWGEFPQTIQRSDVLQTGEGFSMYFRYLGDAPEQVEGLLIE